MTTLAGSDASSASPALRSSDLATKRDTLGVYLRRGSAQIFVALSLVGVMARFVVGGFGLGDLLVVLVSLVLVGVVEWFIHLFLLHAPESSRRMRLAQTGTGHQQHHRDPTALDTLLLSGTDAAVFSLAFGVFTAGWVWVATTVLDTAWLGPFVTGWTVAAIALAHYEWVHLLVHTRYRCRTRYYKRLARNHRLHHFRNERYWLGVTTNSGDRVMGTYPKHKTDVELSDTARTLG